MLAATGHAVEWSRALDDSRPRLIAHRLPLFAIGWLLMTGIWGLTLVRDARLSILPATCLFVFQLGTLITAIAICHHGARPNRIPIIALAACVLLSLSSTSFFAAIGGYGETLALILLTLFLASAPLFAWSGRAALVLLVGTLLPWLLAIPFLRFFLHPLDLSAAIAIAAGVGLIVLEGSKRNARVVFDAGAMPPAASSASEQIIAPLLDEPIAVLAAPQGEIGRDGATQEHDEIAKLREPLLKLRDEEVAGLRKELQLLRREVNEVDDPSDDAGANVRASRRQAPPRGMVDDYDLREIARLVRRIESDGRRHTAEELAREIILELGLRRGVRMEAAMREAISRARTDASLRHESARVPSTIR